VFNQQHPLLEQIDFAVFAAEIADRDFERGDGAALAPKIAKNSFQKDCLSADSFAATAQLRAKAIDRSRTSFQERFAITQCASTPAGNKSLAGEYNGIWMC